MSTKINFIQLTNKELSNKVALLVLNKARIVFWKISPRYYEGNAATVIDNRIIIKYQDLSIRLQNEKICLNFNLNQMEYFVKGIVVSQNEEREEIEIELDEHCFRVEKRDFLRLQVYPYYDVYAYLKYSEEKKLNVVFFNKSEQKKNDLFSNIKENEKQKLALVSSDLYVSEEEELAGFRVEDISVNGMCFFSSQKEYEYIISKFNNQIFNLVLSFGTSTFNLHNVQIVYAVNYIHQQFAGVPMFKIGITFKEDDSLVHKIKELTGDDGRLLNYPKEFEEFIKNE